MKELRPALLVLIALTVLCGGVYPAVVTLLARTLFPYEVSGSLVRDARGREVGSALLGQPFADPKYFWPRPSATAPRPYNAGGSGGSNLGPTNPALLAVVADRVAALRAAGVSGTVPSDLVLASASGLDPDITPAAAHAQVPRVARVRGLAEAEVRTLVDARVEGPHLGLLGEPRVNVLLLNLALDRIGRGAGTGAMSPRDGHWRGER